MINNSTPIKNSPIAPHSLLSLIAKSNINVNITQGKKDAQKMNFNFLRESILSKKFGIALNLENPKIIKLKIETQKIGPTNLSKRKVDPPQYCPVQ